MSDVRWMQGDKERNANWNDKHTLSFLADIKTQEIVASVLPMNRTDYWSAKIMGDHIGDFLTKDAAVGRIKDLIERENYFSPLAKFGLIRE